MQKNPSDIGSEGTQLSAEEKLESLINPLKLVTQYISEFEASTSITSVIKQLSELDKGFASVASQMGRGAQISEVIQKNFAEATKNVIKLGGSTSDVVKIQEDLLTATNRNIIATSDIYDKLFATQKVTGLAVDELATGFLDAGMSISHITEQMSEVVSISTSLGVNAKTVSSLVVNNLDKLNRYGFENGVEGLSRMAAQASMLRVNMNSVFTLADEVMNPERAIEIASTIQSLGVVSGDLIDPYKLMDLAQNNLPELQNQVGELFKDFTKFNETTGQFEIIKSARRDLKGIASALQMDTKEAEKFAISMADLGKKISEISFADFDLDEDTKTAVANLATFNKGTGRYEITTEVGAKSIEEFLQTYKDDADGLKKFLEGTEEVLPPGEDKMINLATQQVGKLGEIQIALNEMTSALKLNIASTKDGRQILTTAAASVKSGTELTKQAISEVNIEEAISTANKMIKGEAKFEDYTKLFDATKDVLLSTLKAQGKGVTDQISNYIPKEVQEIITNILGINLKNQTENKSGVAPQNIPTPAEPPKSTQLPTSENKLNFTQPVDYTKINFGENTAEISNNIGEQTLVLADLHQTLNNYMSDKFNPKIEMDYTDLNVAQKEQNNILVKNYEKLEEIRQVLELNPTKITLNENKITEPKTVNEFDFSKLENVVTDLNTSINSDITKILQTPLKNTEEKTFVENTEKITVQEKIPNTVIDEFGKMNETLINFSQNLQENNLQKEQNNIIVKNYEKLEEIRQVLELNPTKIKLDDNKITEPKTVNEFDFSKLENAITDLNTSINSDITKILQTPLKNTEEKTFVENTEKITIQEKIPNTVIDEFGKMNETLINFSQNLQENNLQKETKIIEPIDYNLQKNNQLDVLISEMSELGNNFKDISVNIPEISIPENKLNETNNTNLENFDKITQSIINNKPPEIVQNQVFNKPITENNTDLFVSEITKPIDNLIKNLNPIVPSTVVEKEVFKNLEPQTQVAKPVENKQINIFDENVTKNENQKKSVDEITVTQNLNIKLEVAGNQNRDLAEKMVNTLRQNPRELEKLISEIKLKSTEYGANKTSRESYAAQLRGA
jgi:hypothetical protein